MVWDRTVKAPAPQTHVKKLDKPRKFYAVSKGHAPGIYCSWKDVVQQIRRHPNPKFKKFSSLKDANLYMRKESFWLSVGKTAASVAAHVTFSVVSSIFSLLTFAGKALLDTCVTALTKLNEPTQRVPSKKFLPVKKLLPAKKVLDTKPVKIDVDVMREHMRERALVAFTDGACHLNGSIMARAGYAVVWPYRRELDFAAPLLGKEQTSDRAEFMAALHCLDTANRIDPSQRQKLIIYTDSKEVIHTMTRSVHALVMSGWQNPAVRNIDIIKIMYSSMTTRKVELKFVKAHTGRSDFMSKFNDKADWMAKRAIALPRLQLT